MKNASLPELALRPFVHADTLDSLKEIVRILKSFQKSRPARRAPELLDLLLLWYFERDTAEEDTSFTYIKPPPQAESDFIRWCWRCASSTYGYATLKALGLLPGLPKNVRELSSLDMTAIKNRCGTETNVLVSVSSKSIRPAFWVGYSKLGAVLAVRGTADVNDAVLNLVCAAAPLRRRRHHLGQAHAGMSAAARKILIDAEDALLLALKASPPGTPLVITGHSLGGGVALLCAFSKFSSKVKKQLRRGKRSVRIVAFAPPPVYIGPGRTSARLDTYFVTQDLVPALSFASVAKLFNALDRLDANLSPRLRLDLLVKRALLRSNSNNSPTAIANFTNTIKNALRPRSCSTWRSVLFFRRDPPRRKTIEACVLNANQEPSQLLRDAAHEPILTIPGNIFRLRRDGSYHPLPQPYVPIIQVHAWSFAAHLPTSIETALEAWFTSSPPP